MSGRHGQKRKRKPKAEDSPPSVISDIPSRTQIAQAQPEQTLQKTNEKRPEGAAQMKIVRKPDPFDLALLGLILTAIIALIYYYQLRTMQEQLTEARKATEIQERPWLSVEVKPVNGLIFVNDKQAALALKFSIKNVGHSIAKDIQIDVRMFPSPAGMAIATDAVQHQKELCDPPKASHMIPFDLFAIEQPAERQVDISAIPSAGQLASVTDGNKTRDFVGLYIVGCVTYHSSFGNEIRQTYFAYHLIRPIPRENGKLLMLADGTPLMMGFEMGVNVPNGNLSMMQELFARNDAY